jgi:hypothetical protein
MEADMTRYLAGVLSVIAIGVLLIAYGLLNPRAPLAGFSESPVGWRTEVGAGVPTYAAYPVNRYAAPIPNAGYGVPAWSPAQPYAAPAYAQPATLTVPAAPQRRTVSARPASTRRVTTSSGERRSSGDLKKTALMIGGSAATGAGVGAIIGGKKGALIGAALAGGASTLYETLK